MEIPKGRLTVLADNVVGGREDGIGEHGFSALVETRKGSYLFDTGSGRAVAHNAVVYGKDLKSLSKILISHGHGDHTGGLAEVLRFHERIDIVGHPDMFLHRFRRGKDGRESYNGIPYTRGYLERLGARFRLSEEAVEIEGGVYLSGPVPRVHGFEMGDMGNRYAVRDGREVVDAILDDESLIIRTERGLLILLGCAHSGMINIIEHSLRMMGEDTVFAVFGGTHLDFSGEEQLEKTIQALRAYDLGRLVPGHCTGMGPAVRLSQAFPNAFSFCQVGATLEF